MQKKKSKKTLSPLDKIKREIARELGCWERIKRERWGALSAQECGKIGGILAKK